MLGNGGGVTRKPFVIGLDPGDTTGIAILDKDGICVKQEQLRLDDALAYPSTHIKKPELVEALVIEDFILYRRQAHKQVGQRFQAVQVIGAWKAWAAQNGIRVVIQPANIKAIAQKWSKVVPPTNHSQSHWIDAFNHAYYFMVREFNITTTAERRRKNGAS